jgi:hypothetical protein
MAFNIGGLEIVINWGNYWNFVISGILGWVKEKFWIFLSSGASNLRPKLGSKFKESSAFWQSLFFARKWEKSRTAAQRPTWDGRPCLNLICMIVFGQPPPPPLHHHIHRNCIISSKTSFFNRLIYLFNSGCLNQTNTASIILLNQTRRETIYTSHDGLEFEIWYSKSE